MPPKTRHDTLCTTERHPGHPAGARRRLPRASHTPRVKASLVQLRRYLRSSGSGSASPCRPARHWTRSTTSPSTPALTPPSASVTRPQSTRQECRHASRSASCGNFTESSGDAVGPPRTGGPEAERLFASPGPERGPGPRAEDARRDSEPWQTALSQPHSPSLPLCSSRASLRGGRLVERQPPPFGS